MRIVVFTDNNARLYKNADLKDFDPAKTVINPDLSLVTGEPPHFWKIEDGKIVPMAPREKVRRLSHINIHGSINEHGKRGLYKRLKGHMKSLYPLALVAAGVCIGFWIKGSL